MTSINWGIIGCGNVTEVKSGPAFNKVPYSSLVAVMRRDGDKAADYAQRHGVPKWYNDADALINDPDVNAIYIATPPSSHEAYALASLAAGKPVYVEKPMAMNAASCLKMAAAAEEYNTKLSVAHYRRQMPMFKKVHELLQAGAVGEPRFINLRLLQAPTKNMIAQTTVNWRVDPAISGGGLFHDLAPHQLDLLYYFFGEAARVSGYATNQAGAYAADDLVTGTIVFEDNVVATGLWCFSAPVSEVADVCEIVGSEGKMSFPFFGDRITLSTTSGHEQIHLPYPIHVQQPMIEEVVKYFLGMAPNPCAAKEAAVVMQWMDTMTEKS